MGNTGSAEHTARDSALVYAGNGIVYMALKQVSTTMRDMADITNYAGRMLVGAYDPDLNSVLWMNE